jgi:hypothetical protein
MCAVVQWACVTVAGMAAEYTGTNSLIIRPVNGNRFRWCFDHDSTKSGSAARCIVRIAESATDSVTYVDPAPTVAQIGNTAANWLASTTANSTARAYRIVIDDGDTSGLAWMHMMVNANSATGVWTWGFIGDYVPALSADTYNSCVVHRNLASEGISAMQQIGSPTAGAISRLHHIRSYDGTIKSSFGGLLIPQGDLGTISQFPTPGSGYAGGINFMRCPVFDRYTNGATIGTQPLLTRGWIPNIHTPQHSGAGSFAPALEDFTYTAWAPGALFRIYTQNTSGAPWMIIEETETYYPPTD